MLKIREDSTQYVQATIVADHDLSDSTIRVALPKAGAKPTTWVNAEVVEASDNGSKWTVKYRVLIGPQNGDIELSPGLYDWTVKLEDFPEVPVLKAGQVQVTAT